jgi:hypothetical protein
MKCGKGPSKNGNSKSNICPVASETSANGLNGGINGGRICWVIAEDGCKDKVKCSDLYRGDLCYQCEFRYNVRNEEGLLSVCKSTGIFLSI